MMFSNCCSNSKVCFLESHIRGATFQTGRTRGTTFHYINWFIDIPNKVCGIFPLYLSSIIPQYICIYMYSKSAGFLVTAQLDVARSILKGQGGV